ncbi:MAG: hypothetical protein ACYC1Q_13855 [Bacteroidia bacterium]
MLRNPILFLFLLATLLSCNRDFQAISSMDRYAWARKTDTFPKMDTLSFQVLNRDSLYGQYNFSVLPGYQGHYLVLNPDSTFIEGPWSDVLERRNRTISGKWYVKENTLILKWRFKTLTLRIHQYSWATFLVPMGKEGIFAYEFNRSKDIIDRLEVRFKTEKHYVIERELNNFRTLCFLRRMPY